MKVRVGFASDVGRQRQRNEDSYAVFVPWAGEPSPSGIEGFLLVADGMGGEAGGDRASRLVCERMRAWFTAADYRRWEDLDPDEPLEDALRRAFSEVGAEVRQIGRDEPELRGIGTTAVLVVIAEGQATIAHVGDSRCYRIRNREIERLTVDHSWVERQVEAGVLTREQAASHPQRNILTRSIGDDAPADPDLRRESVLPGDLFVLCSDGLTGGVGDDEILALATEGSGPQEMADRLVARANEVDGSDNVTVVVGRYEGEDPATDEITRPDLPAVGDPDSPARERGQGTALVVFCLLLGAAAGWVVGARPWEVPAPPSRPSLESRAEALVAEGRVREEHDQDLAALESYRQVRALFQEAEVAVEAQRGISRLERELATGRAVEPEVSSEDPAVGSTEPQASFGEAIAVARDAGSGDGDESMTTEELPRSEEEGEGEEDLR